MGASLGDGERHRFVVAKGQRLDVAVAEGVPALSRAQAARLIGEGRVWVAGQAVVRPAAKVTAGDAVEVEVPPPAPVDVVPQALPLPVVYQDDAIAVVDKPAGMVVHPAPGHADGTLVNALLHHLDGLSSVGGVQRPGLVHRLDRGTSGLVVVARTDAAHRALSAQFADHSAGRTYLAWVHDPPAADAGTCDSVLARHPRDRLRYASTDDPARGKRAVTHWVVLARQGRVGLVQARLETGRTHQVRVHLRELGCPLLGDGLYAWKGSSPLPATLRGRTDPSGQRPMLHAWQLALTHPSTGAPMRFVAAPPPDFAAIAEALALPLPVSADTGTSASAASARSR
ncbi:MAG: RluA family pseudouridine synthase [Myxococcota bacterium]